MTKTKNKQIFGILSSLAIVVFLLFIYQQCKIEKKCNGDDIFFDKSCKDRKWFELQFHKYAKGRYLEKDDYEIIYVRGSQKMNTKVLKRNKKINTGGKIKIIKTPRVVEISWTLKSGDIQSFFIIDKFKQDEKYKNNNNFMGKYAIIGADSFFVNIYNGDIYQSQALRGPNGFFKSIRYRAITVHNVSHDKGSSLFRHMVKCDFTGSYATQNNVMFARDLGFGIYLATAKNNFPPDALVKNSDKCSAEFYQINEIYTSRPNHDVTLACDDHNYDDEECTKACSQLLADAKEDAENTTYGNEGNPGVVHNFDTFETDMENCLGKQMSHTVDAINNKCEDVGNAWWYGVSSAEFVYSGGKEMFEQGLKGLTKPLKSWVTTTYAGKESGFPTSVADIAKPVSEILCKNNAVDELRKSGFQCEGDMGNDVFISGDFLKDHIGELSTCFKKGKIPDDRGTKSEFITDDPCYECGMWGNCGTCEDQFNPYPSI